jgi:hypothetical protein
VDLSRPKEMEDNLKKNKKWKTTSKKMEDNLKKDGKQPTNYLFLN